jgi:hypothetical protein
MTSKMTTVIYLHNFGTESAKKAAWSQGNNKVRQQQECQRTAVQAVSTMQSEPNKSDAQFCIRCKMVLNYDTVTKKWLSRKNNIRASKIKGTAPGHEAAVLDLLPLRGRLHR